MLYIGLNWALNGQFLGGRDFFPSPPLGTLICLFFLPRAFPRTLVSATRRRRPSYAHGGLLMRPESGPDSYKKAALWPVAEADRVIGVVLLCAHPRNALYVEKWTFMCSLRGSKMGRLVAVLGQFRRCWGHEVPFLRCFGQIWPRNAI